MTTMRYAPMVFGGAAAPVQTRPDEEVVHVRRDLEFSRPIPAARQRTLSVLVADDCRDATDSLSILLQLWGHDVRVAYSGRAALALAVADRPDVLLLDLAMPGMDGCALARQIRRHPSLDGSLLVAVTGYADEVHRRIGRAAGFNRFLVKPVDPSAMEELLRAEKNRRARESARQAHCTQWRFARSRAAR
jgi:CheY-like chemotaxis protein